MIENLEIETKVMIDKDTYHHLSSTIEFNNTIKQTNYYYKANVNPNNISLRIREINNNFLFTAKQKIGNNRMEYEENLMENNINSDSLTAIYNKLDIKGPFTLVGQCQTIRSTLKLTYGEIMLDHSFFDWGDDYEIEYEAIDDSKKCQNEFIYWLKNNDIKYTYSTASKTKRALMFK